MTIMSAPFRLFRRVMDPNVSPLRHLPAAQRFQVTCMLGTMWTLIFCLSAGAWSYYSSLALFHVLMASGVLITGLTFRAASRKAKTHRDYPLPDGGARYDDIWGA